MSFDARPPSDRRSRVRAHATVAESDNPWLTSPSTPGAEAAPAPQISPQRTPAGALAPQSSVLGPDVVDRLHQTLVTAPGMWFVGTHGGAGESTLAQAIPGTSAANHSWPYYAGGVTATNVLLVARTSAAGLKSARLAAQEWAASVTPHVHLHGLVLVHDAPGRLPRPLREFAALISGGVPRVWQLPWHEPWRLGEPVTPDLSPAPYKKLAADIGNLLLTTEGSR